MIQRFTIQGRLIGYNDLKSHWRDSWKLKKSEMERIGWEAKRAGIKPVSGKVEISIKCYEPNARRDVDNVYSGACKVVLDALQACGILKGDGQKYVEKVSGSVTVDKKNPRVEVTISEV